MESEKGLFLGVPYLVLINRGRTISSLVVGDQSCRLPLLRTLFRLHVGFLKSIDKDPSISD